MNMREIFQLLDMACRHGYPVRVYARVAPDAEPCAYDGWVWDSTSARSVTVCEGEQRYTFEWGEIEEASFYTPLAERLTGAWLLDHL